MFGHISKERQERLVKNEILPNLNFTNLNICMDRIKGKQTKYTKKGVTRGTRLLEIIHTDICGLLISHLSVRKNTLSLLLMIFYVMDMFIRCMRNLKQ